MLIRENEPNPRRQPALIVADLKYKGNLEKTLKVSPDRFKTTPIVDDVLAEQRRQNGELFDVVIVDISANNWKDLVKQFVSEGANVYVVSVLSSSRAMMEAFNCGAMDYGHDPSEFFWREVNPPEG